MSHQKARRCFCICLCCLFFSAPLNATAQEFLSSRLFEIGRELGLKAIRLGAFATQIAVHDDPQPLRYRFFGNKVILTPLLERSLSLPKEGKLDQAFTSALSQEIEAFYHELGYELARVYVSASPLSEEVKIIIDEGRIDKILFAGSGALDTFDLRNSLHLPSKTYNRFWLEEELERLRQVHGFVSMEPRLVTRKHAESMLQLDEFLASGGALSIEEIWISSRGQYELVIDCERPEGEGGLSYGTNYQPPLGLQVFLDYKNRNFLFDGDRYSAGTTVFVDTSNPLNRVSFQSEWKAPKLALDWLRIRTFAELDLLSRSRSDIGILDYLRVFPSFGLGLEVEPLTGLEISLSPGYAYEYLNVYGLADEVFVDPGDLGRHMPFMKFGLRWFEESALPRREHPHELQFKYTTYLFWSDEDVNQLSLKYRRLFELGFDDLIVSAIGGLVRGEGVHWQDEQSLASEVLRAVAADNYTKEHLQLGVQYRISLVRDLAKLGLSAGLGFVGEPNREEGGRDFLGLASIGPSAHLLFLDSFQLDVFYSFGFNHSGDRAEAVGFNFAKIY